MGNAPQAKKSVKKWYFIEKMLFFCAPQAKNFWVKKWIFYKKAPHYKKAPPLLCTLGSKGGAFLTLIHLINYYWCSLKGELNQLAGRCAELTSSDKITHRPRQTILVAILIMLGTFPNTFLKNFMRFWRAGVHDLQWNSNEKAKIITFWAVLDFKKFIFKFSRHTGTPNLVRWQQKAQKWTYQKV